ncbi:MAG: hypothetical protein IT577_17570, partial [Verrucomicrobiae bacterium]|nr:hypothetical protein [Verrucomicrobiae bacterium]
MPSLRSFLSPASALVAIALATAIAAQAQTSNLWVGGLTGAVGSWTNTANWNPADVPDSTTEIADFTSDWTG